MNQTKHASTKNKVKECKLTQMKPENCELKNRLLIEASFYGKNNNKNTSVMCVIKTKICDIRNDKTY